MTAFLDELARSMAKPLPRQRVLRLLGGALVGIAVPGFATTARARAASSFHLCKKQGGLLCECNCKGDVCQRICCKPAEEYECYCGSVAYGAACKKKPCREPCPSDVKCCKEDEFCANSLQQLCCKQGERGCGPRCCKPNEECKSIRIATGSERVCEKRCPQGQAWCGRNKCCPPKWNCANEKIGLCKRCRKDQEECDKKCCDKSTSRCCGKAGCCPKSRSCCVTGDTQICCPSGKKCAIPILAGDIGTKPGTAAICCPSERLNNSPKLCCPPGQVALNSPGFRTPPPGISPYCCPPSMICRSGATAYCANLQSDPENCGSCGTRCASRYCSAGVCVFP